MVSLCAHYDWFPSNDGNGLKKSCHQQRHACVDSNGKISGTEYNCVDIACFGSPENLHIDGKTVTTAPRLQSTATQLK